MTRILVPVSLAIALLQWSGWLHFADIVLNPVMRLLHLPSEAAFPIITGMFINIYAVIAILSVVHFSMGQMILIAIFTLMVHNIITEGIIQHNSGMNGIKVTAIRTLAGIITVFAVSYFVGDTTQPVSALAASTRQAFWPAMTAWGIDTGKTLLKIFGIIMGIMIVLEVLTVLKWDNYLYRFFRPFMKVLGLSDRTVTLWVAAVIFGLMYGSAVILEKSRQQGLTKSELERLHLSIGMNHSMVEDPALFWALGIGAFWLYIPKLLMAVICAQGYRGIEYLGRMIKRQTS